MVVREDIVVMFIGFAVMPFAPIIIAVSLIELFKKSKTKGVKNK